MLLDSMRRTRSAPYDVGARRGSVTQSRTTASHPEQRADTEQQLTLGAVVNSNHIINDSGKYGFVICTAPSRLWGHRPFGAGTRARARLLGLKAC